MKAIQAVILEPHKTGLREVEISDPAPDQFLVETKVSAISAGTELAVYTGSHQWLKDPSMPDWKFPFRPGYSAAGVVLKVGKNITGLKEGDRVSFPGNHASHELLSTTHERGKWWKLPENLDFEKASVACISRYGMGASIQLDQAPLKYAGLSYTEIWISESQERMILSVPKENLAKLKEVCKWEGVEAVELGIFENTGRLKLFYQGTEVGDIELDFLHNGRPKQVRKAAWKIPPESTSNPSVPIDQNLGETLLKLLSSLNICSKEWIIRQS